jgi:hypothetical protein
MYRIVPKKYPSGLLLIAPTAFAFAGIAVSLAVWVFRTTLVGQGGWLVSLATFGLYVAAMCVIVGIVGVLMIYDAFRNGSVIVFDDQLTMHFPWSAKTRSYVWSEIARVEAVDEQMVVRETEFWVPLPLGAIVAGSDFILGVELFRERTQSVRKFRIMHRDGRTLAEIPSNTKLTFTIVRWLSRKTLSDIVTALGGRIEWKNDAPQLVSLSGSRLSTEEWEVLKREIANIQGLEEIDLSGTSLDDGALAGLETFPSLRHVKVRASRISPSAIERLHAALAEHASQNRFDFLER